MESLILRNEIPCHGSGNASCGRKCYVEQRIKKLNDEQKNTSNNDTSMQYELRFGKICSTERYLCCKISICYNLRWIKQLEDVT